MDQKHKFDGWNQHLLRLRTTIQGNEGQVGITKIFTPYSSIMSVRNLVSTTTEIEGWDPSESDEDWMMLSRSSKTTTEGA